MPHLIVVQLLTHQVLLAGLSFAEFAARLGKQPHMHAHATDEVRSALVLVFLFATTPCDLCSHNL